MYNIFFFQRYRTQFPNRQMYCSQVRLTSDQSQWWLWSRKIILKSSCFSRQIANVAYGFLSFDEFCSWWYCNLLLLLPDMYYVIIYPDTWDYYLQGFKESSNFRRGFYTVLCGRAWKVNVIHPDAYGIGFIWSPTAYSLSLKIKHSTQLLIIYLPKK